jgi:hypothetical protein
MRGVTMRGVQPHRPEHRSAHRRHSRDAGCVDLRAGVRTLGSVALDSDAPSGTANTSACQRRPRGRWLAEARRTSATRHAVSACSLRAANIIPLVVPLARFSAWMARIQADGPRRRRRMAAPFRDDPGAPRQSHRDPVPTKSRRHPGLHEIAPAIRGPHEIAPAVRGPDEIATAISWGGFVGWFRGVVSWGGLVRRSCRLDSAVG